MKGKLLVAIGLVLAIGLIGAVSITAAEGEIEVAGRRRVGHGIILEIDGDSLILQTRRGEITALTDENTRFRIPGVEEPGLDDLNVGDHIGAAGQLNADGTALALWIVRLPQRAEIGLLRGELSAKGDDWLELTRPDGAAVTILIGENTRFRIHGVEEPGLDDLNLGDRILTRGLWNGSGELQAQLIGRIPDGIKDGLYGQVTAVEAPNIELLTRQGPAVIVTDENTRFYVPGVEGASLADIAVDDTILAGGVMEDDGLRAIIVGVNPERPQWAIRRGTVTANDGSALTLETPNGTITVLTDENTRFRVAGVENPTLDDIEVGFQAIAGGQWNPDDGTLLARMVGARPGPAGEETSSSR